MLSNNVIKKLKIDLQRCLCLTEFHSFFLWKTKCLYNELCTIPRWSHILWFLSKHIKTISHMDHTITLFISIVYQCSYHPISNIRYLIIILFNTFQILFTPVKLDFSFYTISDNKFKIGKEWFCCNKRYGMFIHKWVKLEQTHDTVWPTIFSILCTIVPNTQNGYANNVFHKTIIMWHMQSPLLPCRIDFICKSSWKSTAIMMIRLNDFRICTETLIPNWLSLDLTNQYEYISGKG